MRFTATNIEDLKIELERALSAPDEPRPVYSCTTKNLPPAAAYPFAVAFNITLNVLVASNGSAWFRADTGAAV